MKKSPKCLSTTTRRLINFPKSLNLRDDFKANLKIVAQPPQTLVTGYDVK